MMGDDQNVPNIKMDQSITDSAHNKSDMHLLRPQDREEEENLPSSLIEELDGMEEANRLANKRAKRLNMGSREDSRKKIAEDFELPKSNTPLEGQMRNRDDLKKKSSKDEEENKFAEPNKKLNNNFF